jgi:hypothetical protein
MSGIYFKLLAAFVALAIGVAAWLVAAQLLSEVL